MSISGRIALAALGMLAYQNRDRLSDYLRNADRRTTHPNDPLDAADDQDVVAQVAFELGMMDLKRRFTSAGYDVERWSSGETTRSPSVAKVRSAFDGSTLAQLAAATGLAQAKLVKAIATDLPGAVADHDADRTHDQSETDNLLDDVPISRQ